MAVGLTALEWTQLLVTLLAALGLAALGMMWLYRQSAAPSREARQIEILRGQLADEMARNDKLATRSDRLAVRVDALEAEQETLRAEMETDREEAATMREEIGELRAGIRQLIHQLEQAQIPPVWHPPAERPKRARSATAALVARIESGFDMEEMNSLAFDVGINRESFTGQTLSARAREMVKVAERLGKLKEMAARVEVLRPGK